MRRVAPLAPAGSNGGGPTHDPAPGFRWGGWLGMGSFYLNAWAITTPAPPIPTAPPAYPPTHAPTHPPKRVGSNVHGSFSAAGSFGCCCADSWSAACFFPGQHALWAAP